MLNMKSRKEKKRKFFYGGYANEYDKLGITDTYYLAYRDLPKIIHKFVKGRRALDYGCGTGRSTRFLSELGFWVIGVDIDEKMLNKAKENDSSGKYFIIKSGNLGLFEDNSFDFILSALTFDSISSKKEMIKILKEMERVLKKRGIIINITSTPDLHSHNWASFTTNFPENQNAKSGSKVRINVRGTKIIAFDYLWKDLDFKDVFEKSKLNLIKTTKPLAKGNEPYKWINETKIAPWSIYILKK